MKKTGFRKLMSFLLVLVFVVGQLGLVKPDADVTGAPVLIITGTGVKAELAFTLEELKGMQEGKLLQYYSSVNRVGTKKLQAGEGIQLSQLLKLAGADGNYSKITFEASDGFKREFTREQITAPRYYYPEILNGKESGAKAAETVIAFRNGAVTAGPTAGIKLQDVEGNPPLQLMLGQTNIKDVNNSLFVSGLTKIVIGDPMPAVFVLEGAEAENKAYTMADLRLMSVKTEKYTYMTKGGEKTNTCKGIMISDLLGQYKLDGSLTVRINTTDAATYPVAPVQVKDMTDPLKGYMLVFEVDGQTVNDAAGIRIYSKASDSSAVIKNVTGITVEKANADGTSKSPYKHISYDGAPYNVDAVSSATLTIEGPGLVERQIVTVSQVEGMEAGIQKGTFSEKLGGKLVENNYEGVTVEYLLDNIVKLKPNVESVIFWDENLQKIGEFSLEEVKAADSKGLKMMVAYGINEVPFVFNNTDAGYIAEKFNDGGYLKLVLNGSQNPSGNGSETISRIQVNEGNAKGVYEHSYAPYNKPQYLYDTVTITGSGIGREVVYSIKDLEDMASAKESTLGFEGMYSLQNSLNYWNNHVLKGVKLYELLLKSGMNDNLPDSTPVQIIAKDGYNAGPITLGDIRNSAKYGVYIKGMKEPVRTGLPVLLSYGADGYPYVPLNTDEGFVNGIDNNGGPIRATFGQKSEDDINGPAQIKYVSKIIIGEDSNYPAHLYGPYAALKDYFIRVKVFENESTQPVKMAIFRLSDLEKLTLDKTTYSYAMVRDYYAVKKGSEFYNDFYQGIGLWYLLKDKVRLSGSEGTVTFRSKGADVATIGIDELNKPNNDYSGYYNGLTGAVNKKPVLAYSKNGYPLVESKDEKDGYVSEAPIDIDGQKLAVKNNNGPLVVLLPQSAKRPDGLSVSTVDEIVVRLTPDPCSHVKSPYSAYNNTITIKGNGVKKATTLKITEIEEMLDYITKADYYVLNQKGTGETAEYKGIALYDLIRETAGLQPNAEKVKITAEDGYSKEISLQEVVRTDYINEKDSTARLKMLVAYGKNGKPLIPSDKDDGYDADAKNSGGPLTLVVGQKSAGDTNSSGFIKGIKEIEVISGEMTSWKHDSAMYQSYLDTTMLRLAGSELEQPVTLTLRQLEALNDGVIRDKYTSSQDVAQFEGIDLRYLIEKVARLKPGVQKPTKITVYSGPKYQRNVDVNQVWSGVVNTSGQNKKIILGYAREGYPLVGQIGDTGYVKENDGGPIKLIIEENISMWIKWTDVIVVGEGGYEEPKLK